MKYPKYLSDDAAKLIIQWKTQLDKIVTTEKTIVDTNLSILYSQYDIMSEELIVSPLLEMREYEINDKRMPHIMMPRYLATQSLEFYWAELSGVDLFLQSLINYGDHFKGEEIIASISSRDYNNLYQRINIVMRKFLSYQYVTSSSILDRI